MFSLSSAFFLETYASSASLKETFQALASPSIIDEAAWHEMLSVFLGHWWGFLLCSAVTGGSVAAGRVGGTDVFVVQHFVLELPLALFGGVCAL